MKWEKVSVIFSFIIFFLFMITGCESANETKDDALSQIKKRGTLIVATSADYMPYEFQILKNRKNKIVGMDIDLAKAIAKDLGVKLEVKNMQFDSVLASVTSGKSDIAISGFNITEEHKKSVDFSIPYYHSGQLALVNKNKAAQYTNLSDFNGKQILVQQGSVQNEIAKKQLPNSQIVTTDTIPNGIIQLQSGKVAAMILDSAVAQGYEINKPDLAIAKVKFIKTGEENNGLVLPKHSGRLKQKINKIIKKQIISGKIKEYLKKNGKLQAKAVNKNGAKENEKDKGSSFNFNFLPKSLPYFYDGAIVTLIIAFFVVLFGLIIGTIVALVKLSKGKILRIIANLYVEILRGTPMLLQILVWYVVIKLSLPSISVGLLDIDLGRLFIGIFALSLNSGAYISEVIRAGVQAVSKGQKEAAYSLGLSSLATMRYVVLPQAFKNVLPALGNEFITILKDSSLLTTIGLTELLWGAKTIQANSYQALSPLLVAGVFYLGMTFSLSCIFALIEKRLAAESKEK
ncbi:MAG: ABC transporter substrate-binding protein/permease [Streptococcaceae bacterium]|nr:ABC transporter substrate-binding protein/permease [Streptococcaceae bacterium]